MIRARHTSPPTQFDPAGYWIRKHQDGRILYLPRIARLSALGGHLTWTAHHREALTLHRDAVGPATRQVSLARRQRLPAEVVRQRRPRPS